MKDERDSHRFEVEGLSIRREFARYSLLRRPFQEIAYGRAVAARLAEFRPDVVISGNAPLLCQTILMRWALRSDTRFLIWLQDVLSVGISQHARRRFGAIGRLIAIFATVLERRLLQRAENVILISDDFRPVLEALHVSLDKTTVIENWAPIGELPVLAKDNPWTRAHALQEKFVFLYSGTLGLKHDPSLLRDLAVSFRDEPDVMVVVVTEGLGAEYLARERERLALENLKLLPYQAYADLPAVHASADVLVVLLEAGAGVFSVPSKLLAYLCSQRAVLAAVPAENLSTRIIQDSGGGRVVGANDRAEFLRSARLLRSEGDSTTSYGLAGRKWAEQTFDIGRIADSFERVLGVEPAEVPVRSRTP